MEEKKYVNNDRKYLNILIEKIKEEEKSSASSDQTKQLLLDSLNRKIEKRHSDITGNGKVTAEPKLITLPTFRRMLNPEYRERISIAELDKIAIAGGYSDWEYCRKEIETSETLFEPNSIKISKLMVNDEIVIGWYPKRYFRALYLGEYTFRVIESNFERRKVGDTFKAPKFDVVLTRYLSDNDDVKCNVGFKNEPDISFINPEKLRIPENQYERVCKALEEGEDINDILDIICSVSQV